MSYVNEEVKLIIVSNKRMIPSQIISKFQKEKEYVALIIKEMNQNCTGNKLELNKTKQELN